MLNKLSAANCPVPTLPGYYYIRTGDFSVVWLNVVSYVALTIFYVYSLYTVLVHHLYVPWIYAYALDTYSRLAITAGAHRLWSHRSYRASLVLRVFLAIGQCVAGQNSIFVWARDHRVHHKWSDSDADPHNVRRGFFFAHVGWLFRRKHPELLVKCRTLDFSGLLDDPVVRIQHQQYWWMYFMFAVVIPVTIPMVVWNEPFINAFLIAFVLRYMTTLHSTWFVNSSAHMFGDRPYDASIKPAENIWVAFGALGEGFHNFHHAFPSDYATSENGHWLNTTRIFIDLMVWLGLASDRKQTSSDLILKCKHRAKV